MSEPLRWNVEVGPDDLAALEQRLEWALQHQNHALAHKIPTARIPVEVRRIIGVALSMIGIGLVLAVQLLDPFAPRFYTTGGIILFSITLVLALALPKTRAWSRRRAGQSIARRAAAQLRPMARSLPASFEYTLYGDHLDVRSREVPGLRPIALGPQFLIATDRAVFVFGGPTSLLLRRTIHVAGERECRAVLEAFAAYGGTYAELHGPVEGYADRVPPARVRA